MSEPRYTIRWQEVVTEEYEVTVSASELADLADDLYSETGRINPLNGDDMAELLDNPGQFDLANTLSEYATSENLKWLVDTQREDITITVAEDEKS